MDNGWGVDDGCDGWRMVDGIHSTPHVRPFVPWMSQVNNIAWLNIIEK